MLSWLGCAKADVVGGWDNAAVSLIRFLNAKNLHEYIPVEHDDLNEAPQITLERIGKKYGCLISGGRVNFELAGQKFIEAFSSGRLGAVCLELPNEERAIDFHDEAAYVV